MVPARTKAHCRRSVKNAGALTVGQLDSWIAGGDRNQSAGSAEKPSLTKNIDSNPARAHITVLAANHTATPVYSPYIHDHGTSH